MGLKVDKFLPGLPDVLVGRKSVSRWAAAGGIFAVILVLSISAIKIEAWKGFDFGLLMWAEDGKIFLKQSVEMGPAALLHPYAGYLHFYPRLVALISGVVPLHLRPVIFFAGWVVAVALMACIAYRRATTFGMNPIVVLAAVALIVLQPHSGEVFFTLTNAQWFLAIALALLLLIPGEKAASWGELVAVAVFGLTGPFIIIFFPAFIFQVWLLRRWKAAKFVLLVGAVAAIVQLSFIVGGAPRVGSAMLWSVNEWVAALGVFFSFGHESLIGVVAASIFWSLLCVALAKDVRRSYKERSVAPAFFLAAACIYAAGLYAVRSEPSGISPTGSGARYFFIPYALIFFSVCVMRKAQPVLLAAVLLTAVTVQVFAWNASAVPFVGLLARIDRQTTQSLQVAEIKESYLIQINPSDGWSFSIRNEGQYFRRKTLEGGHSISNDFQKINVQYLPVAAHRQRFLAQKDPQLIAEVSGFCTDQQRMTLAVELEVEKPDFAQAFWSVGDGFIESRSLQKAVPAGPVSVDFVFPRGLRLQQIRFDPMSGPGYFDIYSASVSCLNE